jgi:hypothetical protein
MIPSMLLFMYFKASYYAGFNVSINAGFINNYNVSIMCPAQLGYKGTVIAQRSVLSESFLAGRGTFLPIQ